MGAPITPEMDMEFARVLAEASAAYQRIASRFRIRTLRNAHVEMHVQVDRIIAEAVVNAACDHFAIGFDEMISRRRQAHLVATRALVVWGLRAVDPPRSYPAIGRLLGLDHTSAIYLHRKAILLRLSDPAFQQGCSRIVGAIAPFVERTANDD